MRNRGQPFSRNHFAITRDRETEIIIPGGKINRLRRDGSERKAENSVFDISAVREIVAVVPSGNWIEDANIIGTGGNRFDDGAFLDGRVPEILPGLERTLVGLSCVNNFFGVGRTSVASGSIGDRRRCRFRPERGVGPGFGPGGRPTTGHGIYLENHIVRTVGFVDIRSVRKPPLIIHGF